MTHWMSQSCKVMKRIYLLILFFSSTLHSIAGELPRSLAIDTAKIAWIKGEYEDENTRTIIVYFKEVESISSIEVAQLDEGFTIPYIFTLSTPVKNYFKAVVDKEYDTFFTMTGYNDSGYIKTEFVLHPKEITKTVTLGVEEVSVPEKKAATIFPAAGRMVWRGSSTDVGLALNKLPRGIYLVKEGKTTKKVSVKP